MSSHKKPTPKLWGLLRSFNPGTKKSHSKVTVTRGKGSPSVAVTVRSPHAAKTIAKRRAANKVARQSRKRNRT